MGSHHDQMFGESPSQTIIGLTGVKALHLKLSRKLLRYRNWDGKQHHEKKPTYPLARGRRADLGGGSLRWVSNVGDQLRPIWHRVGRVDRDSSGLFGSDVPDVR